jgi:ribonuclease HI
MKQVYLITDGACIGNPGPGGWACILRYGSHSREIAGSEPETTNNRMELRAVIEGFKALRETCEVIVRTDSQYLRIGITEWIYGWKANGWMRKSKDSSRKEPVKNRDLWEELDRLRQQHEVRWEWTKGHANDPDNNRCDKLANEAARLLEKPLNRVGANGRSANLP